MDLTRLHNAYDSNRYLRVKVAITAALFFYRYRTLGGHCVRTSKPSPPPPPYQNLTLPSSIAADDLEPRSQRRALYTRRTRWVRADKHTGDDGCEGGVVGEMDERVPPPHRPDGDVAQMAPAAECSCNDCQSVQCDKWRRRRQGRASFLLSL